MSQYKDVRVHYQRLVNTGNYENETFSMEVSATLENGTAQELEQLSQDLFTHRRTKVARQIKLFIKRHKQ